MSEGINSRGLVYLIRGILFGAILIALIFASGLFLRPPGVDDSVARVRAFHQLKPDAAEVIVYGSSRALRSVDPLILYNEFGIGAYNYGGNWQKINTTQMFIHDSLQTQAPRIVLVEMKNVSHLLWNTEMTGEIYYTGEVPWSMNKLRYLVQCFRKVPERYISYLFPVFAIHENWQKMFKSRDLEKRILYILSHHGYAPTPAVRETTFGSTDDERELSAASVKTLDRIVSECQAAGAQVLLYVAPSSNPFHYCAALTKYAKEHGCGFVDGYSLKDEMGIDVTTDYKDKYHLNSSGAAKMTRYLGRYLKEHYELTDMRTVEGSIWEESLSEAGD